MPKPKQAIEDFRPDPRLVDERGPTRARLRKAEGQYDVGGATGAVTVRDAPIEQMLSRGVLTEKQYQALGKFRIHWYHGGLSPHYGTLDPNRIFAADVTNYSGMAKSERQVFHRQQWRAANIAIGLRGSWIVQKIVCEEISAEQAGRQMGWKNRPQAVAAATQALRDAADRLCSLWGM